MSLSTPQTTAPLEATKGVIYVGPSLSRSLLRLALALAAG